MQQLFVIFRFHREFRFDELMSSFIRFHAVRLKIQNENPAKLHGPRHLHPSVWLWRLLSRICCDLETVSQIKKIGEKKKTRNISSARESEWTYEVTSVWFSVWCHQMGAGTTGQRVACRNKSFGRFLLCKSVSSTYICSHYARKLTRFPQLFFPPPSLKKKKSVSIFITLWFIFFCPNPQVPWRN